MKTIAITGASKGIGRELATKLAGKNVNLILGARSMDKLSALKEELKDKCNSVLCLELDVSKEKSIISFFDTIRKQYGCLDILINNAGIGYRSRVKDIDIKKAKELFDVNFFGLILCCRESLKGLINKGGKIVNIASEVSFRGLPTTSIYCASKAAVKSFSESLQDDARKQGIDVIVIYPGYIKTEFHQSTDEFSDLKSGPRNSSMSSEGLASYIAKRIRSGKFENIPSRNGHILKLLNALCPKMLSYIMSVKYKGHN